MAIYRYKSTILLISNNPMQPEAAFGLIDLVQNIVQAITSGRKAIIGLIKY